jgi:creatinine amidohydrolase
VSASPENEGRLGALTTAELAERLASAPGGLVALVPVGSTEPHGPHLPLETDTRISEAVAHRARRALAAHEPAIEALVCPSIPYGVTDFAEGFSGAISLPKEVLVGLLRSVGEGLLAQGFSQVCFVNNHLEPAHDQAVREAALALGARAGVACPLTRKWARTLTDEFKSGACHAGQYETSLVLAIEADLVKPTARSLPPLTLSLSDGIRDGLTTFRAMGMAAAYTGDPAHATASEGEESLARLTAMVVGEVVDLRHNGSA